MVWPGSDCTGSLYWLKALLLKPMPGVKFTREALICKHTHTHHKWMNLHYFNWLQKQSIYLVVIAMIFSVVLASSSFRLTWLLPKNNTNYITFFKTGTVQSFQSFFDLLTNLFWKQILGGKKTNGFPVVCKYCCSHTDHKISIRFTNICFTRMSFTRRMLFTCKQSTRTAHPIWV